MTLEPPPMTPLKKQLLSYMMEIPQFAEKNYRIRGIKGVI
jgi:hypothetical protein